MQPCNPECGMSYVKVCNEAANVLGLRDFFSGYMHGFQLLEVEYRNYYDAVIHLQKLLQVLCSDSFLFNGRAFSQIDGPPMSCPLRFTPANIFLGHHILLSHIAVNFIWAV